jgi:hypothetical protein
VIIPGNVLTTSASGAAQTYTPDQIKSMSYPTIARIFNLPTGDIPRTAKIFTR